MKFAEKSFLHTHKLFHEGDQVKPGEKPYSCGKCVMKFAKKAFLDTHELFHESEKPDSNATQNAQKNELEVYSCGHCSAKFYMLQNLQNHVKTHFPN